MPAMSDPADIASISMPLVFAPAYQDYIWGGNTIAEMFGRATPPPPVAESWELSDRPEGMSVLTNGQLAGCSLAELIQRFGPDLLGTRAGGATRFPVLVKILDATRTLSMQVHPNDETAARHGGEAKTEMWHILHATPDAAIYCGLTPGTTRESLQAALDAGSIAECVERIPVAAGDTIIVPGGRVHAIDAGCLLLEVQQNSNTTYRLHDWGRLGADGLARPLHIESALRVINFADDASALLPPIPLDANRELLCECPYFRLEKHRLAETTTDATSPKSFVALFVAEGRVEVSGVSVSAGHTVLLPACLGAFQVAPEAEAVLLRLSFPC